MKASDITDDQIYECVARSEYSGATLFQIEVALPQFPPRVILAKCRRMIARGRLRGCPCGCRGDFRFPWQGFGDRDVANWRERVVEYLRSGPRVFGY
jgi:hypothetical protein